MLSKNLTKLGYLGRTNTQNTNIPFYDEGTPSLDLNFAGNKNLVDNVSSNNLVTFTRASSGTFVGDDGLIQTATTDVPRFDHNPTTGESLGLLVEEQRTNLLLRSEEFDNASWVKNSSTATANSAVAPDGLTTADTLVEVAATAEHSFSQTFPAVSGTTYTFSVFAKSTGASRALKMRLTTSAWNGGVNNQVDFNLTTGSGTVQSGTPTFSAQQLNNEWWHFSITSTATATGTPGGNLHITQSVGGPISYAGDGTSGIYLWGAQLEIGSFPTSYIPTTTATVTRSADVASITGTDFSSWYNQNEGTIYSEGSVPINVSNARAFAGVSDGGLAERIIIGHNGTTATSGIVVDNNTVQTESFTGAANTFPPGETRKLALAYKINDFGFTTVPGSVVAQDSLGTIPTVNRLDIGNAPGRAAPCTPIVRIIYFPTRLSNTTLQNITR